MMRDPQRTMVYLLMLADRIEPVVAWRLSTIDSMVEAIREYGPSVVATHQRTRSVPLTKAPYRGFACVACGFEYVAPYATSYTQPEREDLERRERNHHAACKGWALCEAEIAQFEQAALANQPAKP